LRQLQIIRKAPMYVCLCHGYTDRQVRSATRPDGNVADVYRVLGSPPRCGKCVPMVRDLVRAGATDDRDASAG
jgi:bacterioferritin-associated ferredoxin